MIDTTNRYNLSMQQGVETYRNDTFTSVIKTRDPKDGRYHRCGNLGSGREYENVLPLHWFRLAKTTEPRHQTADGRPLCYTQTIVHWEEQTDEGPKLHFAVRFDKTATSKTTS